MSSSSLRIVETEPKRRQRTLARRVDVEGFGFWSSRDVVYSFRPAECGSGLRFFRDDLPNSSPIAASVENRVSKPRQTSLAVGDAQVDMVEHVLAALSAAKIDNCDIVVTAPEAPGLDGSCAPFIKAFLEAGAVEQEQDRRAFKILEPALLQTDPSRPDSVLKITPTDADAASFEYNLVYDSPGSIPNQSAFFDFSRSPEDFLAEIAPSRTFLTFAEANELRKLGICQRVAASDVLVFGENGPIDNALRFDNECARHKLLDMVGDFALAPVDWIGVFQATKTGHLQNANAVRVLLETVGLKPAKQ